MMTAIVRRAVVYTALSGVALLGSGCASSTTREGHSPAYLILDSLNAAPGKEKTFESTLDSDVQTGGSVIEDKGEVTMSLGLKDIGSPDAPTSPTSNNFVTINRYHVSYRRADGRNTPGVDVPYAFDGASSATISDKDATFTFVLVRVQAKLESPLINLVRGGGAVAISTIADVTFYGKDQTGADVAVTGSISVNFADWADPTSSSSN